MPYAIHILFLWSGTGYSVGWPGVTCFLGRKEMDSTMNDSVNYVKDILADVIVGTVSSDSSLYFADYINSWCVSGGCRNQSRTCLPVPKVCFCASLDGRKQTIWIRESYVGFWFIAWKRLALRFDGSWRRSPGRQNNGNFWEGMQPQNVWQLCVASILEDWRGHQRDLLIVDSLAMGQYPSCNGTNKDYDSNHLFLSICLLSQGKLLIWGGN